MWSCPTTDRFITFTRKTMANSEECELRIIVCTLSPFMIKCVVSATWKIPLRIHRQYCESVGEIQKWSCKWCYAWAVLNVNEFHHNICGMLLKCEIEILRLVSCLTQEVKNRFVCVCVWHRSRNLVIDAYWISVSVCLVFGSFFRYARNIYTYISKSTIVALKLPWGSFVYLDICSTLRELWVWRGSAFCNAHISPTKERTTTTKSVCEWVWNLKPKTLKSAKKWISWNR